MQRRGAIVGCDGVFYPTKLGKTLLESGNITSVGGDPRGIEALRNVTLFVLSDQRSGNTDVSFIVIWRVRNFIEISAALCPDRTACYP